MIFFQGTEIDKCNGSLGKFKLRKLVRLSSVSRHGNFSLVWMESWSNLLISCVLATNDIFQGTEIDKCNSY
jgi:hypothetical protein